MVLTCLRKDVELPYGLGFTVQQIKALCLHDTDAIKAIDKALQRPAGWEKGRPRKDNTVDNVNGIERPTGNSRAAGLRRLEKDRSDLYEQVGKTKTVNEAMEGIIIR